MCHLNSATVRMAVRRGEAVTERRTSTEGSQQGHYLAPNLSSGAALKGCLCLGLMRKAQDAMSEGNNQHEPFITLAACAPGQGPPAHFCGDEIYDKPLSEAKSRQQSSNTHRPPGIL